MNQLVPIAAHVPALVRAAGERAQTRFWEFFVSNIRNPHTRLAYGRSIAEFLAWLQLSLHDTRLPRAPKSQILDRAWRGDRPIDS